jgi:hypothetical protein
MQGTNPGHTDPISNPHLPPGGSRGDDSTHGAVDPASIRRGHEVDAYDTKIVLSVPALVVVFFVLAFVTVSIVFHFVSQPEVDPRANPMAVKRNSEPLNDRLNRIHRGGEVDQPRLEPLRLRGPNERVITSPELPTGNSPELHPEDIVPSPENTPELYKTGWVGPGKGHARISIAEAMTVMAKDQDKLLPAVKQGQGTEPPTTVHTPSESNAGRGASQATAGPPALPGAAKGKNDGKKDEKKDDKHHEEHKK